MKVTKKTRTNDILPLLVGGRLDKALNAAVAVPLKRHVVEMSIGEFAEVARGAFPSEVTGERLAWRCLGKMKTLRDELKAIEAYVKKMQPRMTDADRRAAQGVNFPTGVERMLLDVAQFFSLHSFDEAEKVSVGAWMLIAKDKAATATFERNRAELISKQQARKR